VGEEAKRVALYCPAGKEYIRWLIEGIVRYHREHDGFVLRDFRWPMDQRSEERTPTWAGWRPHGILCHIGSQPGLPEWLKRAGVPVVNTTTDCPHHVIPSVHGVGASRLAAEYLMSLATDHFAFVGHAGRLGSVRLREAFAEELAAHGHSLLWHELQTAPSLGIESLEQQAAAEPGLVEFLQGAPKPLAVFALDADFARVVCRVCRQLGLSIPSQVAVLGVEDTIAARLNDPPLSTIRPPGEQVGYEAMKLLDRLMRGEPPPPRAIEVPATVLIVRDSTRGKIKDDPKIQHALRMIAEEACRGLTVADLVEALHMSRSAFEHRFTEKVGHGPGKEIQQVRMASAKRLLTDTELSITRIAGMVGFTRSSIFGEFFRKHVGMTPTAYRQQHRE
jgi:LacI family transcriptional regulator